MNEKETQENIAFADAYVEDDDLYQAEVKSVPKAQMEIGIDTNDTLVKQFADSAEGINSVINLSGITNLTNDARTRDQIYTLIDTMAQDNIVSTALTIYASYITETNEDGKVMWVESPSADVAKHIQYLLDVMNVDKHLYSWAYSLVKYGDLYLKLYRRSEVEGIVTPKEINKNSLNEDLIVHSYGKNDRYTNYVEMVSNPAEMFELCKYGKTCGYIRADVGCVKTNQAASMNSYLSYSFNDNDVNICGADDYVHACIEESVDRCPEKVTLFLHTGEDAKEANQSATFSVRRGQSILYNQFKIWREMTLLENAVQLNRVTKSQTVRIYGIEVGDEPKESVGLRLQHIKQMVEQKSAISVGNSLQEYTSPAATENNIYIPTRNGQGAISLQEVNSDVDPGKLTDIEYFQNKFFGGLHIPKQFLGQTSDSTGFNGGSSLSIISSDFAKAVKRIQNALVQAVTDAINLYLIDRGLSSYVNKFSLRMQNPTTQEELDRREAKTNQIGMISDVMSVASDVNDPVLRLRLLKTLLSSALGNQEVDNIIQEQIDKIEVEKSADTAMEDEGPIERTSNRESERVLGLQPRAGREHTPERNSVERENALDVSREQEAPTVDNDDTDLPSPSDLGIDFTQEA